MGDRILVTSDGDVMDLPVDRWRDQPDAVEMGLLACLSDPVLDVGCGPGRIVAALASTGRLALGIDPSPVAIDEAQMRRAPVLQRSVFAPLPGEQRWATVLLLDGNIGIGGDPEVLLRRAAELLRPGGQVVAEIEGPGTGITPLTVRIESAEATGPWFPWARVGVDGFSRLATQVGLTLAGTASRDGRWFGKAVKERVALFDRPASGKAQT